MSESTSQADRARAVRVILSAAVLLEALVCIGYGVYLGVATLLGPATDRVAALVLAASALALGVALGLGARAALQGRRGVRSPIVVWQLMQLSVAWLTLGTSWVAFGAVLGLLGVVVIAAAVWPPTFAGTGGGAPSPPAR